MMCTGEAPLDKTSEEYRPYISIVLKYLSLG